MNVFDTTVRADGPISIIRLANDILEIKVDTMSQFFHLDDIALVLHRGNRIHIYLKNVQYTFCVQHEDKEQRDRIYSALLACKTEQK